MDQALTHYPMLLRAARRLTRDDPEDLVQDVYLSLCEHLPAEISQTYLLAGLRFRWIDRSRAQGRHAPTGVPLADWLPAGGDAAAEATTRAALGEALTTLAAHPWGDLLLADAAGWRDRTIAAAAGIPMATVRTRIHRLRHGPLARLSPWLVP